MPGRYRFIGTVIQPLGKGALLAAAPSTPCIFISHKREDSEMAKVVASNLIEMNVDVWLDDLERLPEQPSTPAEHLKLTEAIETGLQSSTHLLALVTPHTKGSWWVPFEIGSCRALRRGLAFLLHRDVSDIPSYMVVGESLVDKEALFAWAEKLSLRPGTVSVRAMCQMRQSANLDKFVASKRS